MFFAALIEQEPEFLFRLRRLCVSKTGRYPGSSLCELHSSHKDGYSLFQSGFSTKIFACALGSPRHYVGESGVDKQ